MSLLLQPLPSFSVEGFLALCQGFSTGVRGTLGFGEMSLGVPREIVIEKKNIVF
jgi:hypothetical protein